MRYTPCGEALTGLSSLSFLVLFPWVWGIGGGIKGRGLLVEGETS